jgi:hypothetical protein
MKSYRMRPATRLLVFRASASAFVFMLATPLMAQRNNPLTADALRAREIAVREGELKRTSIEMGAKNSSDDPKQLWSHKIILEQIKEDFMRIQVIKNEMMRAISINNALDYKHISDTAAEIKKRAARLKTNLALPEQEDNEMNRSIQNEDASDSEQVKALLLRLDGSIQSFVTNALFQKPIIDLQLAAKAIRDLESIIQLSSSMKKSAERLNKTHQKSQ